MPTARQVIGDALTFRLNRLSPGETLDADTAALCLSALNAVIDEINGGQTLLWRETLATSSAASGSSATLGTHWPTLAVGTPILGASAALGGVERDLVPMTMAQYHLWRDNIGDLTHYAHDGAATVYFVGNATGHTVTLRVKAAASSFADLDAAYTMPDGYRSGLADLLAERVASVLVGGVTRDVAMAAASARRRLLARATNPGVLSVGEPAFDVLSG